MPAPAFSVEAWFPLHQLESHFTRVNHHELYPTISVSRPELSQAGKTVLITGGGTGIGFLIAQSFLKAGASTLIITGRRQDVLDSAVEKLKAEAEKAAGTRGAAPAKILARPNDQTDREAVKALWAGLQSEGILVDVLILNAAYMHGDGPLLTLGPETVWEAMEGNVLGPMLMMDGFTKQPKSPSGKGRAAINVSTAVINMFYESQMVAASTRPTYSLTKNAGTLAMQLIAKDVPAEEVQIISFHPGMIHNDVWVAMGVSATQLPFDHPDLPGSFAVWATTEEARFLHGRFVHASWDIDEYSKGELRKRIDNEVDFLRIGVVGLRGGDLA